MYQVNLELIKERRKTKGYSLKKCLILWVLMIRQNIIEEKLANIILNQKNYALFSKAIGYPISKNFYP